MGNSRARAVYEANIPDSFRRPQMDSALEQFVRAKYEAKKYIAREWVQPPMPNPTWDLELEKQLRKKKREKVSEGKGWVMEYTFLISLIYLNTRILVRFSHIHLLFFLSSVSYL